MADERATLELVLSSQTAIKDIDKLRKRFGAAIKAMQSSADDLDFDEAAKSAADVLNELQDLRKSLPDVEGAGRKAFQEIGREIDKVEKELVQVRKETKRGSKAFGLMKKAATAVFTAIAGFVGVQAIRALGRAAITVSLDFEQLKASLVAVTGSQREANEEWEFAVAVSNRLGFAVEDVVRNYVQLVGATRGTSISTKQARDIFVSVSEAIRAVGGSSDDVSGAIRAMQQIISKGVVSAEELRSQLGDRLPRAFIVAAETIRKEGEAIEEAQIRLDKLLREGKLLASEFIPAFSEQLTKAFSGNLGPALETSIVQLNKLNNSFKLAGEAFGTSFLDQLLPGIEDLSEELIETRDVFAGLGEVRGNVAGPASRSQSGNGSLRHHDRSGRCRVGPAQHEADRNRQTVPRARWWTRRCQGSLRAGRVSDREGDRQSRHDQAW